MFLWLAAGWGVFLTGAIVMVGVCGRVYKDSHDELLSELRSLKEYIVRKPD